jgi:hypothetical protein
LNPRGGSSNGKWPPKTPKSSNVNGPSPKRRKPCWNRCKPDVAKRDAQLLAIQDSTAGMYGDLQGLAGPGIEEIEALDVRLLPGAEEVSPSQG